MQWSFILNCHNEFLLYNDYKIIYKYINRYGYFPPSPHSIPGRSCSALITNTKMYFFQKTEDRKVKQTLYRGWYQWKGREYKERV
jgi:hypothetical protein